MDPLIVRRPKPTGRYEMYAWLFMRLSGLLLVILVLIHFFIMHLYYGISAIDWHFVVARYANPFWRMFDLTMVILALLHGLNGMKTVIDDYIHPRGWRVAALCILWTIGVVFMIVGTYTILAFQVPVAE